MKLEDIGFYTLENNRAMNVSVKSPMWRCEILLTDKCNFSCPYCRGIRSDCKGTQQTDNVLELLDYWCEDNLRNIRFSGGEPTLYNDLKKVVTYSKYKGIKRIALSTNGSDKLDNYKELIDIGVNDISISLDACCSSFGDKMAGKEGSWNIVVNNIKKLSKLTYVTVGVVLVEETMPYVVDIIKFAYDMGVSDIRLISSAQYNEFIPYLEQVPDEIRKKYPILNYRINHFLIGRNVRGIKQTDCNKCYMVLDDSAVAGDYHFPCIIYLREGGNPIGKIGPDMRKEREVWHKVHNSFLDPICRKNCLDVCIDYNNQVNMFRQINQKGIIKNE